MNLCAIFKPSFKGCATFVSIFFILQIQVLAKERVVALFTEKIEDTFVFKINILKTAPCKLYGIEFYDVEKCTKDKKLIEEFNIFYKDQIYKFIKPGQNFYISSNKSLGDRWLCEVSNESKILNKTLVKYSLAIPTTKEYKKIKLDKKKSEIEKKFPKIFECLSGKKSEAKEPEKPKEINSTKTLEEEKPKIIIEFRKQFGEDFGRDFGE
ncbi:hypothetical protein [Campylobacter sp. RM16187]|uniref:hypothetical protein n=1 Tax=Campylobacter sp. RM16187 TaxID=1660063 RepID=UPI0021B6E3BF|nr:hypothetical protein [Campylobacter sp. RM16187]QKG28915.1 hypothetical protein CDOMF_0641 [Campylobacter sp. RM16187]